MVNRICGIFADANKIMDTIKTTAIVIAVVIVGLVILIAVCKSELARWIFGGLITICLAITMAFSAIHLNKYYNTQGGIVGKIQSIFDVNTIEIEENDSVINFEFGDVMLVQYNDTDYRAEFNTSDYIELADNESWLVFCNGVPCEVIEYSQDYMIAEYSYLFYDEYLEPKLEDTIYFKFAFYRGSTRLIVITNGGSNAVSLWNSYFQKNDFVVTLDSTIGDYANSFELVDVNLYDFDNSLFKTISIRKGSNLTLPTFDIENYVFVGWSLDKETIVATETYKVMDNINLYALYKHANVDIELVLNGGSVVFNGTTYTADTTIEMDGDLMFNLSSPEKSIREFYSYKITTISGLFKVYTTEELFKSLRVLFDDIFGNYKYVYGADLRENYLKIEVKFIDYIDEAQFEDRVFIAEKLGLIEIPPAGQSSVIDYDKVYSNEILIKELYEYLNGVKPEGMTEAVISESVMNSFGVTHNESTYTEAVSVIFDCCKTQE